VDTRPPVPLAPMATADGDERDDGTEAAVALGVAVGVAVGVGRAPIIVSACLLGVACNHWGGSSPSPAVVSLGSTRRLIPICPEVAGGLSTPRPAAELQPGGRVRTESGEDVTDLYLRGAAAAVDLARAVGAHDAILKARSPSCGCREVYDGSFSRRLTPGAGLTALALGAAGLSVRSEEDLLEQNLPSFEDQPSTDTTS
jgi:uncharacterized protein YbbK (DUF523 family)